VPHSIQVVFIENLLVFVIDNKYSISLQKSGESSDSSRFINIRDIWFESLPLPQYNEGFLIELSTSVCEFTQYGFQFFVR
jgi:hypothetical protein